MCQFQASEVRIKRDIYDLSEFRDRNEKGHTRTFFSEEYLQATKHMAGLMKGEASLSVRTDTAGNLIGRREGIRTDMPTIMVGSHLDTVRGGGRFDGIAGVVAGLEVARMLEESATILEHPYEVIAFLAEEPSPFGISTVGSRGMTGKLTAEMMSDIKDPNGRSLGQAIDLMGGDAQRVCLAKRSIKDLKGYLELHIEQGPILDNNNISIGIVSGIAGLRRGTIRIRGQMDHAGTTPMFTRKDALTAGAEIILALEKICKEYPGTVGTVGQLDVLPNAANVVPGEVNIGLEFRSLEEHVLSAIQVKFEREVQIICTDRKVEVDINIWSSSSTVQFPENVIDAITAVCDDLGYDFLSIPSGAAHDANHIADLVPTGMIFVPSSGGRSHCPEEWTNFKDLTKGTNLLAHVVRKLDKSL